MKLNLTERAQRRKRKNTEKITCERSDHLPAETKFVKLRKQRWEQQQIYAAKEKIYMHREDIIYDRRSKSIRLNSYWIRVSISTKRARCCSGEIFHTLLRLLSFLVFHANLHVPARFMMSSRKWTVKSSSFLFFERCREREKCIFHELLHLFTPFVNINFCLVTTFLIANRPLELRRRWEFPRARDFSVWVKFTLFNFITPPRAFLFAYGMTTAARNETFN